ncbi:pseudo histidine-containing phosphotransfer protein 2 isoform X2 [Elaeis guineensis]|uniref:Histidine-containing phosphotransfer protein n=1 Tax=Elaeis guineensis var. tenera TaxID=51953 RepID=A0A6I9QUR9_ELAGV|nr:pseudo histidine-containing phosphotransfer protein 2 isoform X2 [Elaeis guineensis]
MEYSNLRRQAAYMKKSLFDQGYLDEQFYQLEELQDDVSPNFVEEVVTLFFRDSARLISNIEQALDKCPQEFSKLNAYVHQLKGSSSRCLKSFQKMKREHAVLRQKLESYFQLLRQVGPAEKATRPSM